MDEKMIEHHRLDLFRRNKDWFSWMPLLPFLFLVLAFMFLPLIFMLRGSLIDEQGKFTLEYFAQMGAPVYIRSFQNSIFLSGLTAILATIMGTIIGYYITRVRNRKVQEYVVALCDVTTNFAGAPLAFAFVVILGSSGVITLALEKFFGWEIYPTFSIYSFWGLVLAYTYFQLPLMVLLIIPALSGLRTEWREAAYSLGAHNWHYWRYVGLPILAPSLTADLLLLFANAFGAYATAYTLSGSRFTLVTLQLGFLLTGEVLREPGLGNALGVLTLLLMGGTISLYQLASRRARKWQK
jgi:putative spermidine/putrescine transport system permease protein